MNKREFDDISSIEFDEALLEIHRAFQSDHPLHWPVSITTEEFDDGIRIVIEAGEVPEAVSAETETEAKEAIKSIRDMAAEAMDLVREKLGKVDGFQELLKRQRP